MTFLVALLLVSVILNSSVSRVDAFCGISIKPSTSKSTSCCRPNNINTRNRPESIHIQNRRKIHVPAAAFSKENEQQQDQQSEIKEEVIPDPLAASVVDNDALSTVAVAAVAAAASLTNTEDESTGVAATRTVNERLLAELKEAAQKEKLGARSSAGKKMGFTSFMSSKTDEERQAAIEEARDLNGVNPIVAIGGALVALAGAAGLWALTNFVAEFFATHPVTSDLYFVQRATAVFRNVIMGLFALASGFFGVTGMGILFLGIRVAYGVAKGELDPTPIKKSQKEQDVEMLLPNVWELMLGGQKGRRGRKKNNDNDPPFP